jgi:DUF4097 and DUF4098 domain-containing protein YvlB
MLKILTCALLLAPLAAHANECRFQAPRNATFDLAGVHTLVVEVGHHDLHLKGSPGTTSVQFHGRACASSQERLAGLQFSQRREGDRLILSADDQHGADRLVFFGFSSYAYLDMQVDVPAGLDVEVDVGSGDAHVANVASLKSDVGSGDLDVNGVRGRFETEVHSGDVRAEDVGETRVTSVGSGDFTVNRVRGNISIGSIGSGDVNLRAIGGSVDFGSVGSGDLRVNGVARDLRVARVGSGDVVHAAVAGKVDIPKDD